LTGRITGEVLLEAQERLMTRIKQRILDEWYASIVVQPAWLSSTVVNLAKSITENGNFDLLALLADALEDAGCTDARILTHCRENAEHKMQFARLQHKDACWVTDLILGKRPSGTAGT
jgi:hypothetical protein